MQGRPLRPAWTAEQDVTIRAHAGRTINADFLKDFLSQYPDSELAQNYRLTTKYRCLRRRMSELEPNSTMISCDTCFQQKKTCNHEFDIESHPRRCWQTLLGGIGFKVHLFVSTTPFDKLLETFQTPELATRDIKEVLAGETTGSRELFKAL